MSLETKSRLGLAFSQEVLPNGRLFSGIQRKSGTSRKEVSSLRDGTMKAKPGSAGGPLTSYNLFHPKQPCLTYFLSGKTSKFGTRTLGSRPSSDGDLGEVISPK